MLARVLGESAKLQPVPWLKTRMAAPEARQAPAASAEDVLPLRSRIAELEAALETTARQSHEAGFRAGADAARGQMEAEVRGAVERLAETVADLAKTRAETIRRAEADTVRLAIEIARRVLHREITTDSGALQALIRAALEKLQSQEVYRVRVHPDQERTMKSCLDQSGRGQSVAVAPDPMLPKGGVIFEIGRGALDASVDTQLAEIERGLIDQLEARV